MANHVLVVLSNAKEGTDAAFNEWYTNTHIGDILAADGFSAAQRFKLSDSQIGDATSPYGYLAVYEIDSEDLSGPITALQAAGQGSMEISDALDIENTVAWLYTPITERVTQEETTATRAGA